jgi:hypothetical protein
VIDAYKSAIADARATRARLPAPNLLIPAGTTVIALCVAITLAVIYGSPTHASSQFQEEGGITKLSAFFMTVASLLAGTTFVFSRSQPRKGAWFWLLAALAFGYFAIDEIFQFHEIMGAGIGTTPDESPLFFRNWNDVIVILYGVVALCVCLAFLPEILRLPYFGPMIAIAGFFYATHTAIDSVFERSDRSVITEESSKLFSAASFALAFLTSSIGIRNLGTLPLKESH